MHMTRQAVAVAFALAAPVLAFGQSAPAGSRTPDVALSVNAERRDRLQKALEPLVQQARESYPQAKKRFLVGLPSGYLFEVVATLTDKSGTGEQVFVAVQRIADGFIEGYINNDLQLVSGYRSRDPYRLLETEIVDWCITAPDGEEEGNVVGKWLEAHHAEY